MRMRHVAVCVTHEEFQSILARKSITPWQLGYLVVEAWHIHVRFAPEVVNVPVAKKDHHAHCRSGCIHRKASFSHERLRLRETVCARKSNETNIAHLVVPECVIHTCRHATEGECFLPTGVGVHGKVEGRGMIARTNVLCRIRVLCIPLGPVKGRRQCNTGSQQRFIQHHK